MEYKLKLPQPAGVKGLSYQPTPVVMSDQALAAADRLTDRLMKAVKEEHKAGANTNKQIRIHQGMAEAGKQLSDLIIEPDGQLHGNYIWTLSSKTRSRLPFSRLQKRSTVALAHSPMSKRSYIALAEKVKEVSLEGGGGRRKQDDPRPPPPRRCVTKADIENEGDVTPCRATVLAVDFQRARIVVDADVHQLLEDMNAGKRQWMITEVEDDVTEERQISALIELSEKEVVSAQHLRVREIIVGSPNAVQLARTPLRWTQDEQWRSHLKSGLLHLKNNGSANSSQAQAIATAAMQSFTLWQGPPGTGKTRTLHSLVRLIIRCFNAVGPKVAKDLGFGQVLAIAGTNAAADNLLEGLIGSVRVVRVGHPATMRDDLRGSSLTAIAERSTSGKQALQLREVAAKLKARASELMAQGDDNESRSLVGKERKLLKEAMSLLMSSEREVLDEAQVVVCTCANAGHRIMKGRRFPVLLIDEASQITEPVALIGLVKGVECCVMAGDPQQLPPTVTSKIALNMGLGQTLFARLAKRGLAMELLDVQYRMHPAIADFPSRAFYAHRLTSGVSAADRPLPKGFDWPNPNVPVALVSCESAYSIGGTAKTASLESRSSSSGDTSYRNQTEADQVVRIILGLLSADDAVSLAVLTPYSGQVRLLAKQLSEHHPEALQRVTVASVDAYQGREADVVVFSVVRCNPEGNLGFVSDKRRLNVAITRPRRGLIIVGSPIMLQRDPTWKQWLTWVHCQGAVVPSNRSS